MGFLAQLVTGGIGKLFVDADQDRIRKEESARADAAAKGVQEQAGEREKALQPFQDLYGQQKQRAKDFRSDLGTNAENQLTPYRNDLRRKVASGISDTRSGYNSRGLLYSGLRKGAESDVSANASQDLMSKRADVNKTLNDTANSLDQDATNTGMQVNDIQNSYNTMDNAYRQQLLQQIMGQSQQQDAAIGSALGGAASLGGAITGGLINGTGKAASPQMPAVVR